MYANKRPKGSLTLGGMLRLHAKGQSQFWCVNGFVANLDKFEFTGEVGNYPGQADYIWFRKAKLCSEPYPSARDYNLIRNRYNMIFVFASAHYALKFRDDCIKGKFPFPYPRIPAYYTWLPGPPGLLFDA